MNRRLVVDDGRGARELLLVGTVVVGRDPRCEISHADPRLSRRHAEFAVGSTGVVVRDLESRNGVRVNGLVVKEAVLEPGDVVQIAQLTIRLIDDRHPVAAHARGPATADSSVTIAASLEDDRTRLAPAPVRSAAAVQAAVTVPVVPVAPSDDRTRMAAPGRRAAAAARDLGEVVFREAPAATPPRATNGGPDGLGALLGVAWGRRALAQGLLLAVVVFAISTVPLIVWQHRAFGVTAVQSPAVLVPPLLASVAAGLLVAGLIARTVVRGLRSGDR